MGHKQINNKRRFFIVGQFDEYYYTESVTSMTNEDAFNLAASMIQDIYKLYDELMDHDPSMSRMLLGYGANEEGIVDTSLPIYEYIIQAPETTQRMHGESGKTDLSRAPTILITTGVHGNEKAAVYGAYEFTRQLLFNPQNSRGLNDLKSNFTFRLIPIVNPGGYNMQYRNNLAEVDLNRNFLNGWEDLDHPAKGSAPYSENETKILCQWLAEHKEAFAYIDYHNFTRVGESIGMPERKREMTSYHLSPNPVMDQMYSSLIRRLSYSWKNTYLKNFADLGNVAYGFVYSDNGRDIPSTISEAYYNYGIELAAIPEITYNDPITPEMLNTKKVMELSSEFIINYILAVVHSFKDC